VETRTHYKKGGINNKIMTIIKLNNTLSVEDFDTVNFCI